MVSYVWIDVETYSDVSIKNGIHAYMESPAFEVMIVTYAIDDFPVQIWDRTLDKEMPWDLMKAMQLVRKGAAYIVAHKSDFDRHALDKAEIFECDIQYWRDTLVQARLHSLPGSLDKLCDIFKVSSENAKHKEGRNLIHLFCKPRAKNSKIVRATRETHPKEWEQFKAYAMSDISAMRVLHKKLPRWNYAEDSFDLPLWFLDQKINDRGFATDQDLARASIDAGAIRQQDLRIEVADATLGCVSSATKRDELLAYILGAHGISLPDMKKDTLQRRLDDPELEEAVKQLIRIRLEACTTSTSKYKKLLQVISSDGRLRNALQFSGAGRTRRWSGSLFQPQNLPRPDMKAEDIEEGIQELKSGSVDLLRSPQEITRLMKNAVRGVIVAGKGRKLVFSDLSNIEGRVQAWLAGEQWKLQAFRDYDNGTGHDLYALAYAKSFGITPEEVMDNKKNGDGSMRQIGKVQELALGYEGGVGAFITFAAVYGLDLEQMTEQAWPHLDLELLKEAARAWEYASKQRKTLGLRKKVYMCCDTLKRMWREAHPAISSMWKELRDAGIKAIENKGIEIKVRKVTFRRDNNWLRIILPSGASLCYPSPRIENDGAISYLGICQYTKQWKRIYTYGGKFFEQMCQSIARDIMASNMPAIEATGYPIILTVHDEVITEPEDKEEYNEDQLSALMATAPSWASDIPLSASGVSGYRYCKS
jgi:DNA polymerase